MDQLDPDLSAELMSDEAPSTSTPIVGKAPFRAGFVALVGEPNAGKSTLLNSLLSERVSIVTDKPQTTRRRVTGIMNLPGQAQIVLVDAPGTLKSTSGINRFLQEEVADVISKADVVCMLLAADASEESVKELVTSVRRARKASLAIITKRDLLQGTRTPKYFQFLVDEAIPFVSISVMKRPEEARAEFLTRVVPLLPVSPAPLYDEDMYTTQTMRQLVAEMVREACFEHLRQEIPYGLAVRVTEFKEDLDIPRILCEIVVERDGHKGIVIGTGGKMLKTIGSDARKRVESFMGQQVFLQLHVQVNENWTDNPRFMKEMGYVVPKE